jgi:cell division protein FtsW (lipid II flippase)
MNELSQFLKAFVIGSSFFVFFPYFYAVSHFKRGTFKYSYMSYTFFAPVCLGLMNVVSLAIAKQFNLTEKMRFFIISLLSPTIIILFVTYFKIYKYNTDEWVNYIFSIYLLYFFVFNFIVYYLNNSI